MKKNYIKPDVSKAEVNLQFENSRLDSISGCDTCCPIARTSYDRSSCRYVPGCPQSHTIENGTVVASTCPKFLAGNIVD